MTRAVDAVEEDGAAVLLVPLVLVTEDVDAVRDEDLVVVDGATVEEDAVTDVTGDGIRDDALPATDPLVAPQPASAPSVTTITKRMRKERTN